MRGEHYRLQDNGEVQVWGLGTATHPSGVGGTLVLYGVELEIGSDNYISRVYLPEWLADGIHELVKNKIEQENGRGA